jgi:hypothetical protein
MKNRAKEFAKNIIELCRKFPNKMEGRLRQENDEIIALVVSSIKTARNNKKHIQNPKTEFRNPKSI